MTETLDRYRHTAVQFLLFHLKILEQPALDGMIMLTKKQRKAISDLEKALKNEESLMQSAQKAFRVLFFDEHQDIQRRNHLQSPLRCFMVSKSLHKKNDRTTPNFLACHSISPIVSEIQFTMRIVALDVVNEIAQDPDDKDFFV
jgi:hypothetical protein